MSHPDVLVVGGGVIGLSVAYHAARRGAKVTLLEAGRLGAGASGAAAGMLNAQAETHEPGAFLDLQLRSRDLHRALGPALYEETGLDPEYVWSGTLRVARTADFERSLAQTRRWQREHGLSAKWLDGEEARELEPEIAPDARAALYLPDDGQVNSRRLARALAQAASRRGAEIREATLVNGLVSERGKVTGANTAHGEILAGTVVLAGGVDSARLCEGLGLHLPVHPVKGETLAVEAMPAPVSANVWDEDCYLVPKRDGNLIVGATEEPGVWDRRPTLGGVARLSGCATSLVPALSRSPVADLWGGLRPGTPSGWPVLGPVGGIEGLLLATGHYRNGILLSAVTGEEISALALGEESALDLAPFAYERHLEAAS